MKISFKNFKFPKYNYRKIGIGLVLTIYLGFCALVIIPQVDYQDWYPTLLKKHNLEYGIDFADHKKIEIKAIEGKEQEQRNNQAITTIYRRAKKAGIKDLSIIRSDDIIEIHIPNQYSDFLIKSLLAKGNIQIMALKESDDEEQNPLAILEIQNYESTKINLSEIKRVKLTNIYNGYSYFEIITTSEQKDIWDEIGKKSEEGTTYGTFVDGEFNMAGILSSESTGKTNPTIAILLEEPYTSIFMDQLTNEPIELNNEEIKITESKPLQPESSKVPLFIICVSSILLASLFAILIRKDSLKSIFLKYLLILGIGTILKLLSIPITIGTIMMAEMSFLSIILAPNVIIPFVSIIITLMGIIINQTSNPSLYRSSGGLIVSGIYSIIFYVICYLLGGYENK